MAVFVLVEFFSCSMVSHAAWSFMQHGHSFMNDLFNCLFVCLLVCLFACL
jgi:hypothetical protein